MQVRDAEGFVDESRRRGDRRSRGDLAGRFELLDSPLHVSFVEVELRKTMRKKFEIFNVEQEIKSRQQESELIDKDQARLRENMKALRGSPEEKALLQRYTRELDAQEDRLAGLRKEISDLKAKRAELQAELDTMVMQIGVDETL